MRILDILVEKYQAGHSGRCDVMYNIENAGFRPKKPHGCCGKTGTCAQIHIRFFSIF